MISILSLFYFRNVHMLELRRLRAAGGALIFTGRAEAFAVELI